MRATPGSAARGYVFARHEKNQWAKGGYAYCYYYRIVDTYGNVLASDNTNDWRTIYDLCHQNTGIARRASFLGMFDVVREARR